jgi:hypothetical protein
VKINNAGEMSVPEMRGDGDSCLSGGVTFQLVIAGVEGHSKVSCPSLGGLGGRNRFGSECMLIYALKITKRLKIV